MVIPIGYIFGLVWLKAILVKILLNPSLIFLNLKTYLINFFNNILLKPISGT